MSQAPTSTIAPEALAQLIEASSAINSTLDVEQVLARIVEAAMRVARCEGCSIILREPVTGELVFRASNEPSLLRPDRMVLQPGVGICGAAVATGEPILVGDVSSDQRFYAGVDEVTAFQTKSVLAVPLRQGTQVVGVLEVVNPSDRRSFSQEDIGPITLLANLAATGITNAQRHEEVAREAEGLRRSISSPVEAEFIGGSPAAKRLLEMTRKAASSPATVLIRGESGTGKELVARMLHRHSARHDHPMIVINCGAIPADLLESEMFGHEKGAFTGAHQRKRGRFELAHGSTLFLDEVAELAPTLQVKLLRVLQERTFERVGGLETIHVDVRVISATNRNLEQVVADGTLREDLYYRLNVIPIEVPPLRERRDDIPVLAEHFLKRCAHGLGKRLEGFDPEAMDALVNAPWRGNVRELENIIERASVLTEHDRITVDDLPSDLQPAPDGAPRRTVQGKGSLYDFERQLMLDALDDTGWNISAAARRLKIPRHHLRYRMQKWGIEKPGKS